MPKNSVDVHVGNRLKLRRTMVGMSQDKLGQMVGLTFQQIQKYEKGANRIGASRLYQFATLLDVPPAYFFEGLEARLESRPLEHGGKNRSTIELVRNFSDIEDTTIRSAVAGLIKSIASRYKEEEELGAAEQQS